MLTPAQKATLKTHITTNSDTNALYVAGNLAALADMLNLPSSPAITVWKTSVSKDAIAQNGFNPAELAGLTSLNTQRLQNLAAWFSFVNPSSASVRQFFDDIFSGAGGTNTRAALLALWKRFATRFENLYKTGTGSDASPGTIVVEGPLDYTELIGL